MERKNHQAWVVAVSMGYGHQRTAYPLRDLAPEERVVNANDYRSMPARDRRLWEESRRSYEFISNFGRIPLIGKLVFGIFDRFQRIMSFYPRKNALPPNMMLRQIFRLLKRGWGEHLVQTLAKTPLPLVSTFFTPAYMAEFFGYPKDIYCVVCDTDISRTWAPPDGAGSRITYFAPTTHAAGRLTRYGVMRNRIITTGYPLPKENLGSPRLEVAASDMGHRLLNLDPNGAYRSAYAPIIKKYIGTLPKKPNHLFTVLFSIGGAGAQREIALAAIESMARSITHNTVRFVIGAGTKPETKEFFVANLERLRLKDKVPIVSHPDTTRYFSAFNDALHTADVLWTKPSELSFYAGLGLPIVIAPPIGSQEEFNREWLIEVGAGLPQGDPQYANEWIFDRLQSAWFAEAAMRGYIEIEKSGTYRIGEIIAKDNEKKLT